MAHYIWYIVSALKLLGPIYDSVICFCLQTSEIM